MGPQGFTCPDVALWSVVLYAQCCMFCGVLVGVWFVSRSILLRHVVPRVFLIHAALHGIVWHGALL